MLKALIIGADSVTPDIILQRKELFPTFAKLIDEGTSAAYSTYVQKGFCGSYSSEQNWASLYTGLEPWEHGINTYCSRGEERRPRMSDFDDLCPFWEVLNKKGYTVGLWAADNCVSPVPIDGYVFSAKYEMINTPTENRIAKRTLEVCEKDRELAEMVLEGDLPSRLYPRTLAQQGYSFEELKNNVDLAEEVIEKYHFQDAIENFRNEIEYWFEAMKRTQKLNPVDVLYFYTPTTDTIAHCCMYCDDNPTLIEAYQVLDRYMGDLIETLYPETIIFISDHGQQNFKELIKCNDKEIQREAFAAKDEVIWLKNGYIAFEAHNGALLFTAHALKGTFIASGKGIKKGYTVSEMRTVDFYPTLCEMFAVELPENRSGYVLDIFEGELMNRQKFLVEKKCDEYEKIALIQTGTVNLTDIAINELYIHNRFSAITVIGNSRYKEIFLNNPRVVDFVSFEEYIGEKYNRVYCPVYNEHLKKTCNFRIR